jgi:hypothetical protein
LTFYNSSVCLPRMGWLKALKQSLDILDSQVQSARSSAGNFPTPFSQTADPRVLHFTNNAIKKMRQFNLSENDVNDVFYHGGVIVKKNMMVKKYNGYEIGLYYFLDMHTGQFIITTAWKRDRY